jgi:predicted nucleic acid-binding protein
LIRNPYEPGKFFFAVNRKKGAERLSAKHTATGGHRSMDILHVAAAVTVDATEFLTFNRNQARLASAEGMRVKP